MSSDALLSNIIPVAGSGLLGYAMGFALKKILKWMLIILGFLTGMFFVGVQLLQTYGYNRWFRAEPDDLTSRRECRSRSRRLDNRRVCPTSAHPIAAGAAQLPAHLTSIQTSRDRGKGLILVGPCVNNRTMCNKRIILFFSRFIMVRIASGAATARQATS